MSRSSTSWSLRKWWERSTRLEHLRVQLQYQNGVALRPQASLGPCQSGKMRNLRAQQLPTLEVQSISLVTSRETDWVFSRYVQCWSRIQTNGSNTWGAYGCTQYTGITGATSLSLSWDNLQAFTIGNPGANGVCLPHISCKEHFW